MSEQGNINDIREMIEQGQEIPLRQVHFNPENHNRLTTNLQVYFEQEGEDPSQIDNRHSWVLPKAEEEPYHRKLKVGEYWTPLDLGWLAGHDVAMIMLQNRVGHADKVIPDEATIEMRKKQVLEVALCDEQQDANPLLVPPGLFLVFSCHAANLVSLRSQHETIKVNINVFPG